MIPRKNFEILHTVMVIFVLFEQFSGKFCLHILPLVLRALPNINAMMHFLRTFSIVRAYIRGNKAYCYRVDSKLRKKLFTGTKNIFEIGWWGDASSTYPPGSVPIVC